MWLMPLVSKLWSDMRSTIQRFPLELICAVVGTAAAMRLAYMQSYDWGDRDHNLLLTRIILSAIVVMNGSLALSIIRLRKAISLTTYLLLVIPLLCLLTWFVFSLHNLEWDVWPFLMAAIGVHMAVALSQAVLTDANGFWESNKNLFIRLLTGLLFSGVFILGCELALVALRELFNADIANWMYAAVPIFFLGIFNTLWVLNGIHEQEAVAPFPKNLLIFSQFVLIPLVLLFLVILYGYGAKVVFLTQLTGNVSIFIIILAAVGTLAYLLVYPLSADSTRRWIRLYARWFGLMMLPLTVLLWTALYVRITDYGVTEERYAGVVLAGCLTVISVYLALVRNPNIRIVPTVFVVASLVAAVGPLNITRVSFRSQTQRAWNLLTEWGIIKDGVVDTTAAGAMPDKDRAMLTSIISYLHSYNDSTRLHEWVRSLPVPPPNQVHPVSVTKWLGLHRHPHSPVGAWLPIGRNMAARSRWVNSGSVQIIECTMGRESWQNPTFTFYDDGEWKLALAKDSSLAISVISPHGDTADLDVSHHLVLDNTTDNNHGKSLPAYQPVGHYVYMASFPKHIVKIVPEGLFGQIANGSWKSVSLQGIIIVERK